MEINREEHIKNAMITGGNFQKAVDEYETLVNALEAKLDQCHRMFQLTNKQLNQYYDESKELELKLYEARCKIKELQEG